jgi:hypothetical protein
MMRSTKTSGLATQQFAPNGTAPNPSKQFRRQMMKNAKSIFGAITLGLILSSVALAGDVSTPGLIPPPPPPAQQPAELATTDPGVAGDVGSPGFATQVLIAMLSAYYL